MQSSQSSTEAGGGTVRPPYVRTREREEWEEKERPLCRRLRRSLPPAVTLIDWGSPSLTHSGRRPLLLRPPRIEAKGRGGAKEEKGCCERVGCGVLYSIARRSAIIQVGCFVRTCSYAEEATAPRSLPPSLGPFRRGEGKGGPPTCLCFVRLID